MICHRPTFIIAIALATALFLAARVRADIWISDSLELRVADASIVVRATLETFEPSRNSYEATGRFRVIETLKGKTESSIECMIPHGAMRNLEAWRNGKLELLLCLVKSERYRRLPNQVMPAEWSVLQGHSEPGGIIPLNGDPNQDQSEHVPTTDFQFLSKPDDILKLAREAIHADAVTKVPRGPGGGVTSVVVSVPWDSPMGKILPRKGVPELETVVNEPLGAKAHQWIKTDDWVQKLDGVRVLSHFKSEENIAALKPLLTDPNAQYRLEGRDTIATYPVRTAALEVLKSWGVDATAVVTGKAPIRAVWAVMMQLVCRCRAVATLLEGTAPSAPISVMAQSHHQLGRRRSADPPVWDAGERYLPARIPFQLRRYGLELTDWRIGSLQRIQYWRPGHRS